MKKSTGETMEDGKEYDMVPDTKDMERNDEEDGQDSNYSKIEALIKKCSGDELEKVQECLDECKEKMSGEKVDVDE